MTPAFPATLLLQPPFAARLLLSARDAGSVGRAGSCAERAAEQLFDPTHHDQTGAKR